MHRRRELISLCIHREVARRLLENPEKILAKARDNLQRWNSLDASASLAVCYDEWLLLLGKLSAGELARLISSEGGKADHLRQNSPFAGVLSAQELWQIKKEAANHAASST